MNELNNNRIDTLFQQAKNTLKDTQYECILHGIHEHRECEICVEQDKLQEVKIRNGIPQSKVNCKFSDYKINSIHEQMILDVLSNYKVSNNIILHGKSRMGKTTIACAMANNINLMYIKFYNLNRLKINEQNNYDRLLSFGGLLVIDEYGFNDSKFKSEILHEIYDSRWDDRNLPTMLISNLSTSEIQAQVTDATYNRIIEQCIILSVEIHESK